MTFGDLAALALIDIGIARAGDTLAPSLQDFALTKLDLLLDAWNVNNERVPTLTGTIPTDLYYEPDWPNGSCFLWPVPTIAWEQAVRFPCPCPRSRRPRR